MPHFSSCCRGADEYICQKCGKIFCSNCHPPEWRPDITGHKSAGNVCPSCLEKHDTCPGKYNIKKSIQMPLYDHCREESGFTDPNQIVKYMNRYYGVG
jgi:hypothetical protein